MRYEPLTPETIDRVRPLWLALHKHHQSVAPELAPYVPDETSWHYRRQQYATALSEGGQGIVATKDGTDTGYTIIAHRPMAWNATFDLPPAAWELVSVFVAPSERGSGLGSAMLARFSQIAESSGNPTKLIGAIPSNTRAVSFYQANGHVPLWLTLTRFGRPHMLRANQHGAAISAVTANGVDQLRSLWLALHHHHQKSSPHLGPFAGDDRSWPVVRELLIRSAGHGLLFVAFDGSGPIGLASATVDKASELPAYADTWATGSHIAETKFLVVSQAARGRGIGTALMDTVEAELARRGVSDHLIGAIAPNASAIAFYQSRGFRPAWLELLKTGA